MSRSRKAVASFVWGQALESFNTRLSSDDSCRIFSLIFKDFQIFQNDTSSNILVPRAGVIQHANADAYCKSVANCRGCCSHASTTCDQNLKVDFRLDGHRIISRREPLFRDEPDTVYLRILVVWWIMTEPICVHSFLYWRWYHKTNHKAHKTQTKRN